MKTKSFIQFLGKEIDTVELEKQVKKIWTQQGNLVKEIKDLSLYVKPEESKCYFVINDNIKGSFNLTA